MKLSANDFMLCRIADQMAGMLRELGQLETRMLARKTTDLEIAAPIYITGLARGGTTVLLNALASGAGIGTHRYRDFPFLFAPVLWHRLAGWLAAPDSKIERPHRDGIMISRESPEAFEEPLWQYFFPHVHDSGKPHVLDASTVNREFESFYKDHLKKLLYLRGAHRYLCKGNYNVTRIEYIARMFPDAHFVIAVRHPEAHVRSLVRQHELFEVYSSDDPRIPAYLRIAGHYEFGPQRVPVNIEPDLSGRIQDAWAGGNESLGYAMQWAAIYRYVADLLDSADLSGRIHVVRHEDICARPAETFETLASLLSTGAGPTEIASQAALISPKDASSRITKRASLPEIWDETRAVAERFGYLPDRAVSGATLRLAS